MMERTKVLYPDNDLSQLRLEFVVEVLQTPAEEAVGMKWLKKKMQKKLRKL